MKVILLVLFVALGISSFGESPRQEAVAAAHALRIEKLPKLELKEASLQEALAAMRRVWDVNHPDQAFPVVIADFNSPPPIASGSSESITVSLRNISYVEALRILANLVNRTPSQTDGLFRLIGKSWIEEPWLTRDYEIAPAVLTALKLRADSPRKEVRAALQRYDIEFEDWMHVSLEDTGRALLVTGYHSQQEKVAGLLHLLGKGFKVSK